MIKLSLQLKHRLFADKIVNVGRVAFFARRLYMHFIILIMFFSHFTRTFYSGFFAKIHESQQSPH